MLLPAAEKTMPSEIARASGTRQLVAMWMQYAIFRHKYYTVFLQRFGCPPAVVVRRVASADGYLQIGFDLSAEISHWIELTEDKGCG